MSECTKQNDWKWVTSSDQELFSATATQVWPVCGAAQASEQPDLSTPTKVLDAHIAGLRAEVKSANAEMARLDERREKCRAWRDAAIKALTDFEAEMAKR